MADEDDELSHLRASDNADVDLTEETQDFRFFDKLASYTSHCTLHTSQS